MTEKPPEPDDKEADRRFNETLGRMLTTPHQPHAPLKPKVQPVRRGQKKKA
jgi:hypothetical protein